MQGSLRFAAEAFPVDDRLEIDVSGTQLVNTSERISCVVSAS